MAEKQIQEGARDPTHTPRRNLKEENRHERFPPKEPHGKWPLDSPKENTARIWCGS
jgi:hypothetical protein